MRRAGPDHRGQSLPGRRLAKASRSDTLVGMTVEEAVRRYLESVRACGLAPRVVAEMEFDLGHFVRFARGAPVDTIAEPDIVRFLRDRPNARIKHALRRRRHANVMGLFGWLVASGIVQTDPTADVTASTIQPCDE